MAWLHTKSLNGLNSPTVLPTISFREKPSNLTRNGLASVTRPVSASRIRIPSCAVSNSRRYRSSERWTFGSARSARFCFSASWRLAAPCVPPSIAYWVSSRGFQEQEYLTLFGLGKVPWHRVAPELFE